MDISRLQIDQSKMLASGVEYFKLFEKHLPAGLDSSKTMLVYEICNLSCIKKIVSLNPEAKHIVVGNRACNRALKIVLPKAVDVEYLEELDLKETDMKFDCIIMNPPYQRNLHLKILAEAIKHLKDEKSVCVNLSPAGWLGKYSYFSSKFLDYRKLFNGYIKNIEIIDHRTSNDMFGLGNQIESLGIYTLIKDKSKNNIDLLKYGFKDDAEFNLLTKILKPKAGKLVWRNTVFTKFNPPIAKYEICLNQWSCGKKFIDACIQKKNKRILVAQFETEDEKQNFLSSLTTNFMEWYYHTVISAGEYKIHIYGFMMDNYKEPWTDERFYEFFNLTQDEIKIIEDTMKKYS